MRRKKYASNDIRSAESHSMMMKRIVFAVILAVLVLWIVFSNITVDMSIYEVSSDNIPDSFDDLRILQISDFHNARFGSDNQKLINLVEEAEPDIIVITGDFVDYYHTDIDTALGFAESLKSKAPCYFVTGNHESWLQGTESFEQLEDGLKESGVNVLHDQAVDLNKGGESIELIGIDDLEFARKENGLINKDVKPLLRELNTEGKYSILLSHRPEIFEDYVSSGIDLVLTGHAHGGQVRIPLIGGLYAPDQGMFPKYDSGEYKDGNTTMIVSRGIGNSIIPVRINNQPELVLVILRSR